MPLTRIAAVDALARLHTFDTLIDARSESEFADDHLPGAVNWPSLHDAQRDAVGTEYKQVSAFDARKRGAPLVARNIAAHVEREAMSKPKGWHPLVYCWRGGQRSGALATVLSQIGWQVELLDGGYREYRRAVVAELQTLPQTLELRVVCGTTGSGKSRLLQVLESSGEQVLDLEGLANHRGSVLGLIPGQRQPGQKMFESRLWDRLRGFDLNRCVWVESESRKVGDLQLPPTLVQRMRASGCVNLELALDARVALLLAEYRHFVDDVGAFCGRLDALRVLRGNHLIDAWQKAAHAGNIDSVVRELLTTHYDPVYLQSMRRNFPGLLAPLLQVDWDGSEQSLLAAARRMVAAGLSPCANRR
ncbi:MAG: tRNA 2-selenouridine(34) synthase MnmH [Burkholderiales bacterium]|jgi:tRNA 2-selenouridine synthase|nr:tRNA 2-selenouridine(34) synthase MnmH [Burkholderiales bacterium]